MKIGILTMYHGSINWGGVLQGYALKRLIEENVANAEVDIIDYRSSKNIVYNSKVSQALQYNPLDIYKKTKAIVFRKNKRILNRKLNVRRELFQRFRDNVNNCNSVWSDEIFSDLANKYDCLISGSDQVWNPNAAKPGYFLKDIQNSKCLKISYAASIARDELSKREKEVMIPLIEGFDYISVREKTAKDILDKEIANRKQVKEVLDPTMILTKDQWNEVAGPKEGSEEKYAVAFFFSDSLEYRKKLEEYCKNNNLSLKYIAFASGKYLKNDDNGYGEKLLDVGPIEFLRLFRGSERVFTDSFHGTVFSILFEKPFCVFERDKNTKVSKNSRLYDILEKFDLKNRLINRDRSFEEVVEEKIDYQIIEEKLKKYREESLSFLVNAINSSSSKNINNVGEQIKYDCNGCGLCECICPQKAVSMKQDQEGFYYPIVDDSKCINCRLCVLECNKVNKEFKAKCFVGFNKDESIRTNSSSGGVFYSIAKKVIDDGGCVYGATLNEIFNVEHIRVDKIERLDYLMKSKYVQSKSFDSIQDVIDQLKEGRTVLYSGTPCQVAAISKIVKRMGLENQLILVDFVCHGVPSSRVWESYVADVLNKKGQIKSIDFRDKKHRGWHDYCFEVQYEEGREYYKSHELNEYMRSFLSNKNLRPSCYQCKYKGGGYLSDITLADAWRIEKDYSDMADDKGTTLLIARSKKGEDFIEKISGELDCRKTDYGKWKKMNPTIETSSSCPSGRKEFWNDFLKMDSEVFWKKQSNNLTLKKRFRYFVKHILITTKMDRIVRKYY